VDSLDMELDLPDAGRWMDRWDQTSGGRATLINISENHTFRIDGPTGSRHILRLHRPGYQSRPAIESELAWVVALRGAGMPVPQPLAGRDGQLVQAAGTNRFAVLFAFEPGREPLAGGDLAPLFRTIGAYAATAHLHVERWTRPAGFVRPTWTAAAILDPDGLWGDWRRAPHVEGATRATLDRLDQRLREKLAAYGDAPDRFGLIHADMRLANLLVDGEVVTLIDFDDCGFGWFMYDLAASLSFIDAGPDLPALKRSWLDGYTALRPLTADDLGIIDAMILLRRMALLAWIGSHAETELAQTHMEGFADGTALLAERYMRGPIWPR
jgi:Ser/Thr protein kinase RdoA (MazF antagonist)